MGFEIVKNLNDLKLKNDGYSEINSLVENKLKSAKANEDVEIFSKIVWGKDISKYDGKKVDRVIENVKTLAGMAQEGDNQAKAEINAVVTVTLQQPLIQRLNLLKFLGNAKTVGYNDELRYEYYQVQGEMSRTQASSGAFPFATAKKRTGVLDTKTVTGGVIIDYRELSSGAIDGLSNIADQVVSDMTNKLVADCISGLASAVQSSSAMKNYEAGITKTNVANVLKKVHKFAENVTILGDYDALDALGEIASFQVSTSPDSVRFSEAVMEEIRNSGLIKTYKGNIVVKIPNAYNLTQLNSEGDFYKPYLPTTDLWFVPQGVVAPLAIVYRGGLMSMTSIDINTRGEVTRYDLEYGYKVINEYVPFLGYIYDASLAE